MNTQIKRLVSWPLHLYNPIGVSLLVQQAHVCVFRYHQNVKIMLVAMNSSTDYRQIMELCVCNLENEDCMLQHHCNIMPTVQILQSWKSFLWKNCWKHLSMMMLLDSINALPLIGPNLWSKRENLMI